MMKAIYDKPKDVFKELSEFITGHLLNSNDERLKTVEISPEMKKLLVEEIKSEWEKENNSEGEMQLHKWEHETYDTYGCGGYNYLEWTGEFQLGKPYKVDRYGEAIRIVKGQEEK